MNSTFGSRKLIKSLEKLGFKAKKQVGSRHLKFKCPKSHKPGERNFIIVLQSTTTFDPYTSQKILKQIQSHGFSAQEVTEAFQ